MSDLIIEHKEDQIKQNIISNAQEFDNPSEQRQPNCFEQSPQHPQNSISDFTTPDTDEFLDTVIPQGIILECDVKIIKGWFGRNLRYNFYHSKTQKLLLSVKKSKCLGNHLFLFRQSETQQEIVGTLESNFSGTKFTLYSNGNPQNNSKNTKILRKELAFIHYEYQLLKTRKGNLFKAYIPSLVDGQFRKITPIDQNTSQKIKSRFLNKRNEEFYEFQTLEPIWSTKHQSFTLPFNSRVNSASIHNFLLKQKNEDGELSKQVAIQFGKFDNKYFNIDIAYPLTPIQAFSIVVSQLDHKLLI